MPPRKTLIKKHKKAKEDKKVKEKKKVEGDFVVMKNPSGKKFVCADCKELGFLMPNQYLKHANSAACPHGQRAASYFFDHRQAPIKDACVQEILEVARSQEKCKINHWDIIETSHPTKTHPAGCKPLIDISLTQMGYEALLQEGNCKYK